MPVAWVMRDIGAYLISFRRRLDNGVWMLLLAIFVDEFPSFLCSSDSSSERELWARRLICPCGLFALICLTILLRCADGSEPTLRVFVRFIDWATSMKG